MPEAFHRPVRAYKLPGSDFRSPAIGIAGVILSASLIYAATQIRRAEQQIADRDTKIVILSQALQKALDDNAALRCQLREAP